MTEPYDNSSMKSWTWMSDRMWGAVRNALPDHTIITSADRAGNLERIKLMSPATDDNLIYSFTTYEPYAVGWSSAYSSQGGNETYWNYIGDVPYPIEPGVNYTAEIENALAPVPERYKSEALNALNAYVKGICDGGTPYWKNYYDSLYNRGWHMLRAKSLDDWSKKYGGNIHLMVVEFGCYDSLYSTVRFGSGGPGVPDSKRLLFIQDLRESFEAYGIGWSYWSYNEGFTVFKTNYHADHVGGSPSLEQAIALADYDLLTRALGLKPSISYDVPAGLKEASGAWALDDSAGQVMKSMLPAGISGKYYNTSSARDDKFNTATVFNGSSYGIVDNPAAGLKNNFTIAAWVKTSGKGTIVSSGEQTLKQADGVYNKLMIQDFDSYHNVWGGDIRPDTDNPAQGSASLLGISGPGGGDIVYASQLPRLDLSAYLAPGSSGAMHLAVYLYNSTSQIRAGQLELSSSRNADDAHEFSWDLSRYQLKSGWNHLILKTSDLLNRTADASSLLSNRIYFHVQGKTMIKLDDFYAFFEQPSSEPSYWELSVNERGNLAFAAPGITGLSDSGRNIADGKWHHGAVSFENGTLVYYVDGTAVKTLKVQGSIRETSSADLVIGADIRGQNGFSGSIARLCLYPRALAAGGLIHEP
jgi:hypothetical protein